MKITKIKLSIWAILAFTIKRFRIILIRRNVLSRYLICIKLLPLFQLDFIIIDIKSQIILFIERIKEYNGSGFDITSGLIDMPIYGRGPFPLIRINGKYAEFGSLSVENIKNFLAIAKNVILGQGTSSQNDVFFKLFNRLEFTSQYRIVLVSHESPSIHHHFFLDPNGGLAVTPAIELVDMDYEEMEAKSLK